MHQLQKPPLKVGLRTGQHEGDSFLGVIKQPRQTDIPPAQLQQQQEEGLQHQLEHHLHQQQQRHPQVDKQQQQEHHPQQQQQRRPQVGKQQQQEHHQQHQEAAQQQLEYQQQERLHHGANNPKPLDDQQHLHAAQQQQGQEHATRILLQQNLELELLLQNQQKQLLQAMHQQQLQLNQEALQQQQQQPEQQQQHFTPVPAMSPSKQLQQQQHEHFESQQNKQQGPQLQIEPLGREGCRHSKEQQQHGLLGRLQDGQLQQDLQLQLREVSCEGMQGTAHVRSKDAEQQQQDVEHCHEELLPGEYPQAAFQGQGQQEQKQQGPQEQGSEVGEGVEEEGREEVAEQPADAAQAAAQALLSAPQVAEERQAAAAAENLAAERPAAAVQVDSGPAAAAALRAGGYGELSQQHLVAPPSPPIVTAATSQDEGALPTASAGLSVAARGGTEGHRSEADDLLGCLQDKGEMIIAATPPSQAPGSFPEPRACDQAPSPGNVCLQQQQQQQDEEHMGQWDGAHITFAESAAAPCNVRSTAHPGSEAAGPEGCPELEVGQGGEQGLKEMVAFGGEGCAGGAADKKDGLGVGEGSLQGNPLAGMGTEAVEEAAGAEVPAPVEAVVLSDAAAAAAPSTAPAAAAEEAAGAGPPSTPTAALSEAAAAAALPTAPGAAGEAAPGAAPALQILPTAAVLPESVTPPCSPQQLSDSEVIDLTDSPIAAAGLAAPSDAGTGRALGEDCTEPAAAVAPRVEAAAACRVAQPHSSALQIAAAAALQAVKRTPAAGARACGGTSSAQQDQNRSAAAAGQSSLAEQRTRPLTQHGTGGPSAAAMRHVPTPAATADRGRPGAAGGGGGAVRAATRPAPAPAVAYDGGAYHNAATGAAVRPADRQQHHPRSAAATPNVNTPNPAHRACNPPAPVPAAGMQGIPVPNPNNHRSSSSRRGIPGVGGCSTSGVGASTQPQHSMVEYVKDALQSLSQGSLQVRIRLLADTRVPPRCPTPPIVPYRETGTQTSGGSFAPHGLHGTSATAAVPAGQASVAAAAVAAKVTLPISAGKRTAGGTGGKTPSSHLQHPQQQQQHHQQQHQQQQQSQHHRQQQLQQQINAEASNRPQVLVVPIRVPAAASVRMVPCTSQPMSRHAGSSRIVAAAVAGGAPKPATADAVAGDGDMAPPKLTIREVVTSELQVPRGLKVPRVVPHCFKRSNEKALRLLREAHAHAAACLQEKQQSQQQQQQQHRLQPSNVRQRQQQNAEQRQQVHAVQQQEQVSQLSVPGNSPCKGPQLQVKVEQQENVALERDQQHQHATAAVPCRPWHGNKKPLQETQQQGQQGLKGVEVQLEAVVAGGGQHQQQQQQENMPSLPRKVGMLRQQIVGDALGGGKATRCILVAEAAAPAGADGGGGCPLARVRLRAGSGTGVDGVNTEDGLAAVEEKTGMLHSKRSRAEEQEEQRLGSVKGLLNASGKPLEDCRAKQEGKGEEAHSEQQQQRQKKQKREQLQSAGGGAIAATNVVMPAPVPRGYLRVFGQRPGTATVAGTKTNEASGGDAQATTAQASVKAKMIPSTGSSASGRGGDLSPQEPQQQQQGEQEQQRQEQQREQQVGEAGDVKGCLGSKAAKKDMAVQIVQQAWKGGNEHGKEQGESREGDAHVRGVWAGFTPTGAAPQEVNGRDGATAAEQESEQLRKDTRHGMGEGKGQGKQGVREAQSRAIGEGERDKAQVQAGRNKKQPDAEEQRHQGRERQRQQQEGKEKHPQQLQCEKQQQEGEQEQQQQHGQVEDANPPASGGKQAGSVPIEAQPAHAPPPPSFPDFFPGLMSQLTAGAASQPAPSQAVFGPCDLAAFTQPLEELEKLLADPALGLNLDSDSQDSLKEAVADLRDHLAADAADAAAAAGRGAAAGAGAEDELVMLWGQQRGASATGQPLQQCGDIGAGEEHWGMLGKVGRRLQLGDEGATHEPRDVAGVQGVPSVSSSRRADQDADGLGRSRGCGVEQRQGGWQPREAAGIPGDVPPGSPLWQLLASGTVELAEGPCPEWMLPSQEQQQQLGAVLGRPLTQEPFMAKPQQQQSQQGKLQGSKQRQGQQEWQQEVAEKQCQGQEQQKEAKRQQLALEEDGAQYSQHHTQEFGFSLGRNTGEDLGQEQQLQLPATQVVELHGSGVLQELEALAELEQQLEQAGGLSDKKSIQQQQQQELDGVKGLAGVDEHGGVLCKDTCAGSAGGKEGGMRSSASHAGAGATVGEVQQVLTSSAAAGDGRSAALLVTQVEPSAAAAGSGAETPEEAIPTGRVQVEGKGTPGLELDPDND